MSLEAVQSRDVVRYDFVIPPSQECQQNHGQFVPVNGETLPRCADSPTPTLSDPH